MIVIKSEQEISLMREAGKVCSLIFKELKDFIKPGVSTWEIDQIVERMCEEHKMTAAEKGYYGYPASICTSVNEEVVHGIPSKDKILKDGDIISLDLVVENKGYMADACRTFGVGNISPVAQHLIDTAEKAFFEGLKYAKVGCRLRDVSKAVQETVEGEGFGVVREFVGHGIGRDMHEDPQIPNYVCKGANPRFQAGMTICIEPMITEGNWEVEILLDNWTAVTVDGSLAAHYENTVVITEGEPELLTL